jgi:hypothetical protein
MNNVYAVLTEVVSIQKYVFGSNKLKENLGASRLIQQIYEEPLQNAVKKVLPSTNGYDFDAWRKSPDIIQMKNGAEFEVGYIGGGNALLFFKNNDKAKEFIKEWTKTLLVKTPGIVTAVACEGFDLDDAKFKTENIRLFKELQKNKYRCIPQTIIPRHGITAECSHTGYSMDVWNDKEKPDEQDYVSSVAYSKICASKDAAEKLEKEFSNELNGKYCFTDQLDKLGQQTGESHIAVVHIDGNGMGKRFQTTASLPAIRNLSKSVKEATDKSFVALLKSIISKFDDIVKALGYKDRSDYDKNHKENGKTILPFRPIIIGGDDITFVSEGRLGIYFAKLFLEFFEEEGENVSDKEGLSACAGVAITKTKYPFYRGYQLAEELCGNAKKIRKSKKDNGSWLDFHISYGGFSGTLDDIRKNHYNAPMGELCFRPYKINDSSDNGFETLVQNTKELKNGFPKNKIKELRQALTLGQKSIDIFINHIKARGLILPTIQGNTYHEKIFVNTRTPYFDMVEFMEYYPSFEL